MSRQIGRRDFLKAVGAVSAVYAMGGCAFFRATPRGRKTHPNIVYFLADDLGYGDLACQNPESKIPTPNIDRLAAEGIRFTDAHSPAAVCTPTRYGILTGRYCWRTQLKSGVLWPWDAPLIEAGRLTVPSLLKRHGYHTACVGKWHLGWDWPTKDGTRINDAVPQGKSDPKLRESWGDKIDFTKPIANGPTTRGFDYYFGTAVPNFPPYCFIENDRTVGIPTETKPKEMFGQPGPMLPGWKLEEILPRLGDKAVEYIHARAEAPDTPFFLYFASPAPHTPIVPTEQFFGTSDAARYGDFVCEVDWTVGRILKALDETGLADTTIVIFSSDNGSPARNGENASGPVGSVLKDTGHNPSWILRGMKADIWDGGHRVPFIARWPGEIPKGTVSNDLICQSDLLATCAALLGESLPADAGEDSCNILPAMLREAREEPIHEAVVHHSGNGVFAIRQGKWKLITHLGSGGWTKPTTEKPVPGGPKGQLYDMSQDISERRNLWLEHPDVVKSLTALLERFKTEGRSVLRM